MLVSSATYINPINTALPLVGRQVRSDVLLNEDSILQQLDALIKHRDDTLIDSPHTPADGTSDWLAANFLFNIGCQNLGREALSQINIILRSWTSPDPLSLGEFSSRLRRLRELIAQRL